MSGEQDRAPAFGTALSSADADQAASRLAPDGLQSTVASDGWIEWNGGRCPVGPKRRVEYRMRHHGSLPETCVEPAGSLRWEHKGWPGDIIAYRIVESGK